MSETPDLSDRQAALLVFLRDYITREGWAPVVREMMRGCQISSTSVVAYNLHRLARMGYIKMGSGARMIQVIRSGE